MGQGSAPVEADFGAFEHAAWMRQAKGYERHFENLVQQAVEPLLDAAAVRAGSDVLDAACGPGFVTGAAIRRGANAIGVDFSEEMLRISRARHPWARFERGDAEDLPFPDASFDAVAINFGILHFPQPRRALREAFRVLRPGGSLAFTDWAAPGPDNIAYAIVLSAMDRHAAPFRLPPGPPLFQFAREAVCREALAEAGFDTPSVDTRLLCLTWRQATADGLVSAFRDGSARLGARLKAQPAERLAAIRDAVAQRSLTYWTADGFAIPTGIALTRARKPVFAAAVPAPSIGALVDA
jgi:ubiquinone/menaquinone biosynthesis C-methylase UbiE